MQFLQELAAKFSGYPKPIPLLYSKSTEDVEVTLESYNHKKITLKIPRDYIETSIDVTGNFVKKLPATNNLRSLNLKLYYPSFQSWVSKYLEEKERTGKDFDNIVKTLRRDTVYVYLRAINKSYIDGIWDKRQESRKLKHSGSIEDRDVFIPSYGKSAFVKGIDNDQFKFIYCLNKINMFRCNSITEINKVLSVKFKYLSPFKNGDLDTYNEIIISLRNWIGERIVRTEFPPADNADSNNTQTQKN